MKTPKFVAEFLKKNKTLRVLFWVFMKIEKENLFRSVALLLLCVMIAQPLIDFSEIFQDQVTYAWEIDWNTDTDDEEEKEAIIQSRQECVERLVEMKAALEKIRPLEKKLRYQIDKLLALSTLGAGTVDCMLCDRRVP